MAESDLLYAEITRGIIGSAMEVYNYLGHGFLESVYEESLAIEFNLRGISFQKQAPIKVYYKKVLAKEFVCNFIIDGCVIVELKAIKKISNIEHAQVLNYLKATGLKVGLLLNFGSGSLEYKRLINTNP